MQTQYLFFAMLKMCWVVCAMASLFLCRACHIFCCFSSRSSCWQQTLRYSLLHFLIFTKASALEDFWVFLATWKCLPPLFLFPYFLFLALVEGEHALFLFAIWNPLELFLLLQLLRHSWHRAIITSWKYSIAPVSWLKPPAFPLQPSPLILSWHHCYTWFI